MLRFSLPRYFLLALFLCLEKANVPAQEPQAEPDQSIRVPPPNPLVPETGGPPVPDDNPTANTGALKSQIQTGGSYDAHSGNATRTIPDLRVPGALGVYGLNFTRYWNSLRDDRIPGNKLYNPAPVPLQTNDFGGQGWSHSWNWIAVYDVHSQVDEEWPYQTVNTMHITITFPDGHASKYKIVRLVNDDPPIIGDPHVGQPYSAAEAAWPASGHIHDRLERMATNGSEFWLYRADGGAVHFVEHSNFGYQATEVFDPRGLRTALSYDGNGRLYRVEQDGGRALVLTWSGGVIVRVENADSAGLQAVEYNYTGGLLTSVNYLNDPIPGQTVIATYTYQTVPPPEGFNGTEPLLATANDPRFEGPMRFIRYKYAGTGCRAVATPPPGYPGGQLDYFYASPTAIAEEQSEHLDQNGLPIVVSRFGIGCFDGTRTEYNSLGGFRKFFYGHSVMWPGSGSLGYELAKVTEYTNTFPLPPGLASQRQSHVNSHPYEVWDGFGVRTRLTHADSSGSPSEVRYVDSDNSTYTYNRVYPGDSEEPDTDRIKNPYQHWLFSTKDENNNITTYTRDARRRVKKIDYTGGTYETFGYDSGGFNQITSHRLTSGAIVTYEYDSRRRLEREYNSVDGEADATIYTYYGPGDHPEWTDLVKTVQNGRARANGKSFSAKMEYNGRFQVTKVTYPGIESGANPLEVNPSVHYDYDQYGNCIAITNELGYQSTYTYDDYRRCTSYTEPLNAPDWNGTGNVPSRQWDWMYYRQMDGGGPLNLNGVYGHTANVWGAQIGPAFNAAGDRPVTRRYFDLNNRITSEETGWIQPANQPLENWSKGPDFEAHHTTYDENGQKKTSTDPRGRVAEYKYDGRKRLWKTIEHPIKGDLGDLDPPRTTVTLYDFTGNKTKVTFPDQETQEWPFYDAFGQPLQFIDERGKVTDLTYRWGPMKKLGTVTTHRNMDGGGSEPQLTTFTYDEMGRPQWTIFPDGSTELTVYELGQASAFKTRRDQTKRFHYDARGREDSHAWDANTAPGISRSWDAANRLQTLTNVYSSIDYGYDAAGQVIWEGNDIAGSGGRTQTNYYRYPNGAIAHLHYPGGAFIRNDYNVRGQLTATGWDDEAGEWWHRLVEYFYLPDGKVWLQAYGNGTRSGFAYNGRGLREIVAHDRVSPLQSYSWRRYWRDDRDRITAWQKGNNSKINPMEDGRGDTYIYDEKGQLTEALYQVENPAGRPTVPGPRSDSFQYDALGNRYGTNAVASRGLVTFNVRPNGLNQYLNWTPSVIYYDDNYPDWGPLGNGVMMAEGWITASYNALNQPIAIWSPAYDGTSDFMWFGHDPLGRCVKRWVGESGDIYSNPATYFHYDGWNLLQEGNNAWGPSRIYAHGNRVDEIVASYNTWTGEYAYHHYDARGHCTLLTNSTGDILEQYDYDAFGLPYFYDPQGNSTGHSLFGNRFLFTGREWLSDLRIYDFRRRHYQPELGRFLQPDPKQFEAGDYNLYRYCHNDPVNCTDPFGEEGWTDNPRVLWALRFSPTAIQQVREIKREAEVAGQNAEKQAKENGTFTKTPDIGNAVRHIVVSAELTRILGAEKAKEITDIHEDGAKDKKDSAVDQTHNAVGREIGATSKSAAETLRKADEVVKKADKVILKIEKDEEKKK